MIGSPPRQSGDPADYDYNIMHQLEECLRLFDFSAKPSIESLTLSLLEMDFLEFRFPEIQRLNLNNIEHLWRHNFITPSVRCVQLYLIHSTCFQSSYKDMVPWLSQVHTLCLAYYYHPLVIVQNDALYTLFSQIKCLVIDLSAEIDKGWYAEIRSKPLSPPRFSRLKEVRFLVRRKAGLKFLEHWYSALQELLEIVPTIKRLKVYAPIELLYKAEGLFEKPLPANVTVELAEVVVSETRGLREVLDKVVADGCSLI